MTAAAAERYFHALCVVDLPGAVAELVDLVDRGTPMSVLAREVVGPAQARVGQLWESGAWTVADEHAATSISEAALAVAAARAERRTEGSGTHALIACAEGEWHSLPAKLAAAVVAESARVTVLGASVPAEHLRRRLSQGDVDLLALSCSLATNLLGAARCIAAAHEAGVPVVVGGSAFGSSPGRALRLGADAWCADPHRVLAEAPDRPVAGPPPEPSLEVLWLDAVEGGPLALVHERLIAAHGPLRDLPPFASAAVLVDLRWFARSAAAAELTQDQAVLTEAVGWALRRGALAWGGRGRPSTALRLIAEVVEDRAPNGARRLQQEADRVDRADDPGRPDAPR